MAKGGPRGCRSQVSTPGRPAGGVRLTTGVVGQVLPVGPRAVGNFCPCVRSSRRRGLADQGCGARRGWWRTTSASPFRRRDRERREADALLGRTGTDEHSSATTRTASATIAASKSDLAGRAIDRTRVAGNVHRQALCSGRASASRSEGATPRVSSVSRPRPRRATTPRPARAPHRAPRAWRGRGRPGWARRARGSPSTPRRRARRPSVRGVPW